jgi:hypothetical protein
MKRKQLIAYLGIAYLGIAYLGIAYFWIAYFWIAYFDFGNLGPPESCINE